MVSQDHVIYSAMTVLSNGTHSHAQRESRIQIKMLGVCPYSQTRTTQKGVSEIALLSTSTHFCHLDINIALNLAYWFCYFGNVIAKF